MLEPATVEELKDSLDYYLESYKESDFFLDDEVTLYHTPASTSSPLALGSISWPEY